MDERHDQAGAHVPAPGADLSERDEIEAERARRLAAQNRPDDAEVDNTGR